MEHDVPVALKAVQLNLDLRSWVQGLGLVFLVPSRCSRACYAWSTTFRWESKLDLGLGCRV